MAHLKNPIRDEQLWLSPRQAARVLGISDGSMYAAIHADAIPHRTLRGRYLIPRSWVEGQETGEAV